MPDLKEALSTNFSLNAAGLLVPAGHNQMVVIGDRSLGVAPGAPEFEHAGTIDGVRNAAVALVDLHRSIPLEQTTYFMIPDKDDEGEYTSPERNEQAIRDMGLKAIGLYKDGAFDGVNNGFYDLIRYDPRRMSPAIAITCRTFSLHKYDCIAQPLGHGQILD